MNMKRRSKSSRRSSILKVSRPLDEVHNFSTDDRYPKNKRVSFANTVQIKDFRGDQPTLTAADDAQPRDENALPAQEDAETVIQISTPMGKKRRRISSDTGSKFQRLSIIPKLERSFCLSEESFEVCEDSNSAEEGERNAMKECSLPAEPLRSKDENAAHLNLKENITVNKSFSMDMTMQPSDQQHSSFSLLSPGALLNGSFCTSETTNLTCPVPKTTSVAKESLDFTATSQSDAFCSPFKTCSTTPGGIAQTSSCQQSVDVTVKLPSGPCNQSFSFNAPSLCDSPISCLVDVRSEAKAESPSGKSNNGMEEHTYNNGAVNCQQVQQNETYNVSNFFTETSSQEIRQPDLEYTCSSHEFKAVNGSENEYMNLTHTIQPTELHEKAAMKEPSDVSSGVDLNTSNWLKLDTSCNDFLVIDESMQSPYSAMPIPSVNGSVLTPLNLQKVSLLPNSVTQLRKLQTPLSGSSAADLSKLSAAKTLKNELPSTSTMSQMLSKIRQATNDTSSETTVITTPEAVLVSYAKVVDKQATCSPISSLDLTYAAGEKSIIPSPSAYVKFGAFLNCDQTDTTSFLSPLNKQQLPQQKEACKQSCLSHHLTRVKTRLLQAIDSLRVRLKDSTYTISHEAITPAITILLDASLQALCAVNLLESYGKITDHSEPCGAASPSICTTELLSTTINDTNLLTKVHWLSEMHNFLSQDVYPAVEEAMHIAQTLYYWTLKFWDKKSIQITLAEECNVSFQLCTLEDMDINTPVMKVLSVHIQSSHGDRLDSTSWKTPLIECLHTSDIPKAIFEALKILQKQVKSVGDTV